MARAARSNLENRTNRLKLPKCHTIYVVIGQGISLGYRRPQKGNGRWLARVRIRDTYLKKSVADADDQLESDGELVLSYFEAHEAATKWATEQRNPRKPTDGSITVAQAAEHYMKWYREHRRAAAETQHMINAHILPYFADRLVSELRTKELRDWHHKIATLPARKRSRAGAEQAYHPKAATEEGKRARKSTANRVLTVLKAILNKAFHDEFVDDDTAWRKVKPFENADQPITRFLTEAESVRLINACLADLRQLVKAALFTGARYGELARLRVADVNPDTAMIYISPEAKSGKGRYVPLSAEGLNFFRAATVGKTGNELVFLRKDGRPWGKNHHVRPLLAACENANISPAVGFHELRHTYASLLAQAGADLLTISKLLGHADTRITSRHYAHLCDKTLANAVRSLLPGFGHVSEDNVTAIR